MSAVRMRFPAQALEELRRIDPETAVTLPTIRRLMRSGKVPSVRISEKSNRRLVNLDALFAFLATPTENRPEQPAKGIRRINER